jgi:hypothetical protein
MITKQAINKEKVRVTFSMPASIWADTIYLVGDFNQWSKTSIPLVLDDNGWHASVELESGRTYQYRYLVNNDWRADHYAPNEFGGDNSVVDTTLLGLNPRRRFSNSAD